MGLLEASVAWERLKDEITGLHLLGTATVTPLDSAANRPTYELEVSGYRFRVELVPQARWTVYTDLENAPEIGDFARFPDMIQYRGVEDPRGDRRVLVAVLPDPESITTFPVDIDRFQAVTISREWKVHLFEPIPDSQSP